jgi:excisionase family DNA binding protein
MSAVGPAQSPLTIATYLTPREVAAMLQVSEKTISRWSLEDPSMPVLRRGRVVRFPREQLLAWLERRASRRITQRPRKETHGAA